MAKKKTTVTKKPTTAKKKTTSTRKATTTARKKPTSSARKTQPPKKKTATTSRTPLDERQRPKTTFDFSAAPKEIQELTAFHEPHISLFPAQSMEIIMTEVAACMREFQQWSENNLTLTQRRRKIGAGIRNYGAQISTAKRCG